MKLTEEQLRQYEEDGYFILDNLFSEDEIREIRVHIDRLDSESEEKLKKLVNLGSDGLNRPNQINFTTLLNKMDNEIQKFCCQQKFVDITVPLLGPGVQLYWDQSVYKRPEADRDFPWHQDNGYEQTIPEHFVTCWLALEDATIQNGCIWVLPGSHKWGYQEHKDVGIGFQGYFGEEQGIPVPLKRGSMVVFHSLLFHRSTPNRSNTIRKGYVLQYSVTGARNMETGAVYENGPVIARDGKAVYYTAGV